VNARANRFPLFDSLRAIAALSVLGFHAGYIAFYTADTPLRKFTSHLDVGVTVFFLISGFLLYRPFARAHLRGESAPHTGAYAWRRFLRIVPAYWVALTVVTIWLSVDGVFTSSGIPTFYGFAQIYDAKDSLGGIGQAWTLCVEVTFYAFLPLWALLMRRFRGGVRTELVALALLWVVSLAYKAWALTQTGPTELNSAPYLQPLPNFLDQFAIGMALAVLSVHVEGLARPPGWVEWLRRNAWVPWAVAAAAFVFVSVGIGFSGELIQHYSRRMFLGRHELYTLIAVGLVLPAIVAEPRKGLVGRVLGNRLLTYLGLVSYGIYLYHYAVLTQLQKWIGPGEGGPLLVRLAIYLLVGAAGATLIASISYYVVERPLLGLKRLVSPPEPSERGEATEEPTATAASTISATSAGWRNRGTP
jgi:peptidoglycan/LPS O-acetylase OafA/YrhL